MLLCCGCVACAWWQQHFNMITASAGSWPALQPQPLSSPTSTLPVARLWAMKMLQILSGGFLRFRSPRGGRWRGDKARQPGQGGVSGRRRSWGAETEQLLWFVDEGRNRIGKEGGRFLTRISIAPPAELTPPHLRSHRGEAGCVPGAGMDTLAVMLAALDSVIHLSFPQLIGCRLGS